MAKYSRPNSYTGKQANQDHRGNSRAAKAAEAAAGTSKDLFISPATLASAVGDLVPSATTLIEGVVLLTDNNSPVATKVYADALAIAGAPDASTTVKGLVEIATDAEAVAGTGTGGTGAVLSVSPSNLSGVFAAAPAIGGTTPAAGSFTTLAASGLSSLSASATILTAGATLQLGSDNDAAAVNLGTGTTARAIGIGNSAAAHVITVGSVTGASQVVLNSGTAGIQMASTGAGDITIDSDDTLLLDADGVLEINSSAGVIGIGSDADANAINIGTGAAARTITVGNDTGASSFVVTAGTGAVNLGVNAIAHTTSIGNKTGASALVLDTGTGNFALNGVGATTYTIGAATTSGTVDIGGTAQTGTMTLGDSSGTNIVQIGSGEGLTTVNVAGGATNAKTVNIATGAVANVVTIGSASGAASLDLLCGTGDFTLEGATASTYDISSTGANVGTVTIGAGTGARIVNLATGGTGVKTVNIATAAIGNIVTIGTVTGAASLDLKCGTGDFTLEGATASTYDISSTGANVGTVTIGAGTGARIVNLATGGTGAKTVNIATAAIGNIVTIGTVTAAASLDLKCGTGNFTLEGATASTYDISSTGINTGTCTFASGTGARTVELAGGGTGIKTINIGTGTTADVITVGTTTGAGATTLAVGTGGLTLTGKCIHTPDAITAVSGGTAASVETVLTEITTNGDMDLDDVTLANGVDGQMKIFAVVAVGDSTDSVKITPASLIGGTQITFSANPIGLGCIMIYDSGAAGWVIVGNNGGTVA